MTDSTMEKNSKGSGEKISHLNLPGNAFETAAFLNKISEEPNEKIYLNCSQIEKGFPISTLATIIVHLYKKGKKVTLLNLCETGMDALRLLNITRFVDIKK